MNRRQFIAGLGGAAALPIAARGQQRERMRRLAVLMPIAASDPEAPLRIRALIRGLQTAGWIEGRNVSIDYRWSGGRNDIARSYAAELLALAPDVIIAPGETSAAPLIAGTRTVPIVFVHVPDPVRAHFVESLARPGGNATGFVQFEYNMSGKWPQLLKEIAPQVQRIAVLQDSAISAGAAQYAVIQSVAPTLGVDVSAANVRDLEEVERVIRSFGNASNGGLIIPTSAIALVHRDKIIELAERYKLPAIYFRQLFVTAGGLVSYGPDIVDQYRRAADYVDRILRGAKPADLPVQTPTDYQLAINLKTAKALGLTVPPTLIARADEVIE
jgi:ABC-type uncharacterized transport system substrate-binding protein